MVGLFLTQVKCILGLLTIEALLPAQLNFPDTNNQDVGAHAKSLRVILLIPTQ